MQKRSDNDLTGLILDIQRYSLDDGPGIRTTVFLKGCPLNCIWCQNPESINAEPEVGFKAERCINCCACRDACPKGAIALDDRERIKRNKCDSCGDCAEVCPTRALFVVGKRYSVTELLEEVRGDAAFYEESGGGVTLSGGEPMFQFEFTHQFLKACKDVGLNTAIETNGMTSRRNIESLLPFLDHIYFDIKIMDGDAHRTLAGADNDQILDNARFLAEAGVPVIFRFPVVPNMTATRENVRAIAQFLVELRVGEIELCPYHDGWLSKLAWLRGGRFVPSELCRPPAATELLEAVRNFSDMGIKAKSKEVTVGSQPPQTIGQTLPSRES